MRRSTGKRLRFEVFKRDLFACQYCGAQPPGAVLVIDHVEPVAAGGTSTIDNLITACETCNQGKADRALGNVPVRPDADLMYLATQQEIAELRRFQAAVAQKEGAIADGVAQMQQLWTTLSDLNWVPRDRLLRDLFLKYPPEIVYYAVEDVAQKIGGGYLSPRGNGWKGYLFTVAKRAAAASGDD